VENGARLIGAQRYLWLSPETSGQMTMDRDTVGHRPMRQCAVEKKSRYKMCQNEKQAGLIGYWGLSDWWQTSFSEEEKDYITYRVRTMRAGPRALTEGTPFIPTNSTHNSASFFLVNLINWFTAPRDNSIARRIALKALDLAIDVDDVASSLKWIIRLYHKARKTVPSALVVVEKSCKQLINLTPDILEKRKDYYELRYPSFHPDQYAPLGNNVGYDYLVIILEKRKEYSEVIRLCTEAKNQGWEGNWDQRIDRCKKRLLKNL